jgi:hypothetical protein
MENPKYPDLHAHIAALERNGLLFRVQRPINKDSLGQWPDEFQAEAERATRSEYWSTGEVMKQRRRNDKRLNDPFLSL